MFGGTSANAYMLIYRQRKISRNFEETPLIPDYMQAEIDKVNQKDAEDRESYHVLKNQFDVYLQDSQAFFTINDNNMVQYIDGNNAHEQGEKLRLEFTDTIDDIKGKVRK